MDISFEKLPQAVSQLFEKLDRIEAILVSQSPEQQPPQEQILTIQQASELIFLSVPTIYGLVSRGGIPHSKLGKRLYFSKQELLDWIKTGRKKTSAEIATEADNFLSKKRR